MAKLDRAIHGTPFDPAMQCHCTPDGENAQVCVGFAQVIGTASAPYRMTILVNRANPDEIASIDEPMHTAKSMVRFHGAAGDAHVRA